MERIVVVRIPHRSFRPGHGSRGPLGFRRGDRGQPEAHESPRVRHRRGWSRGQPRPVSDGGEHNFTATAANFVRQESWGTAPSAYGACDLGHPRQYRFEYLYDSNSFDIDFVNTAGSTVRDDDGELFYHATLNIPIQLSKPQEVVMQLSIESDSDRGGDAVVPAFVYSLVRGTDFLATP